MDLKECKPGTKVVYYRPKAACSVTTQEKFDAVVTHITEFKAGITFEIKPGVMVKRAVLPENLERPIGGKINE